MYRNRSIVPVGSGRVSEGHPDASDGPQSFPSLERYTHSVIRSTEWKLLAPHRDRSHEHADPLWLRAVYFSNNTHLELISLGVGERPPSGVGEGHRCMERGKPNLSQSTVPAGGGFALPFYIPCRAFISELLLVFTEPCIVQPIGGCA